MIRNECVLCHCVWVGCICQGAITFVLFQQKTSMCDCHSSTRCVCVCVFGMFWQAAIRQAMNVTPTSVRQKCVQTTFRDSLIWECEDITMATRQSDLFSGRRKFSEKTRRNVICVCVCVCVTNGRTLS